MANCFPYCWILAVFLGVVGPLGSPGALNPLHDDRASMSPIGFSRVAFVEARETTPTLALERAPEVETREEIWVLMRWILALVIVLFFAQGAGLVLALRHRRKERGLRIELGEQKARADERDLLLRTLFAAMNDIVVLHEVVRDDGGRIVDYRIVEFNGSFEALVGLPAEGIQGRLATELYHCDPAPYIEEYARVVETGVPLRFTVYAPVVHRHLLINALWLGPEAFATISTDITEEVTRQRELEARNREIEDFLSAVGQDLREPLVTTQGFLVRLGEDVARLRTLVESPVMEPSTAAILMPLVDGSIPRSLAFMDASMETMERLLEGILAVSLAATLDLPVAVVRVDEVLAGVRRHLGRSLDESGANLEAGPLAVCVGNAGALHQVFVQLVTNALRYRRPGVVPSIRVDSVREGAHQVYRVSDNGPGIREEERERIWDLLWREARGTGGPGTGTGLSLAKRLVVRQGGWVRVENRPEGGAVFMVALPVVDGEDRA